MSLTRAFVGLAALAALSHLRTPAAMFYSGQAGPSLSFHYGYGPFSMPMGMRSQDFYGPHGSGSRYSVQVFPRPAYRVSTDVAAGVFNQLGSVDAQLLSRYDSLRARSRTTTITPPTSSAGVELSALNTLQERLGADGAEPVQIAQAEVNPRRSSTHDPPALA